MANWKITSRNYTLSAEKQTKSFEIYISKNEMETFYWLRIYDSRMRIFSDYITAENIEEACQVADERISKFIEDEIKALNLLKKEWSECEETGTLG